MRMGRASTAQPFKKKNTYSITARDDGSKDVAFHGDTEGQRDDIEQQKVGSLSGSSLAGKNTSLDSGTIGDGLVRVDALLILLAWEWPS